MIDLSLCCCYNILINEMTYGGFLMKKQKVDANFMKQLKDLPICSSVDNSQRYEERDGYKNDEVHLSKLRNSYEKYNYLTN